MHYLDSPSTRSIYTYRPPVKKSLEFLSNTLSNGTGFAYPDLVENVNFD